MQQTLTQMNDRTEALDRLATQKEAASKAKAEAERKLQVLRFEAVALRMHCSRLCGDGEGWAV